MNLAKALLVFLALTPFLHAQSPARKFEVGAGYSLFRTSFLPPPLPLRGADKNSKSGITTRVGYSFYDHLAAEAELNLFPRDLGVFSKGMTEALFGPRVGWRSEKVGIFGKVRPGFIHFHKQRESFPCAAVAPPPLVCVLGGRTEFALDTGGVVEFYPHPRITLRFDMGDTMIRFRGPARRYEREPVGVITSTSVDGFWSHSFQFGTSVGFRF